MLQVLNARERNEAFLQFLLFFLLTTALIVGAVYFNFAVPQTEKKQLREEVFDFRSENFDQQKFVTEMEGSRRLLESYDSLSKIGKSTVRVEEQLRQSLVDLKKLSKGEDSSAYGKLNNTVIYAFAELKETKGRLNQLNSQLQELNQVKMDLVNCNAQLDNFRRQYDKLSNPQ